MPRPLKIGIYSPFFGSTIGGGEKYLGVTAEAIRDAFPGHRVDLIGAASADRQRYERMLRLDLSGIEIRSTNPHATPLHRALNNMRVLRPVRSIYLARQTARWTRRYDLFLTMVYVIPAFSRARRSVILCQFPYEIAPHTWNHQFLPRPLNGLTFRLYSLLRRRLLGDAIDHFDGVICQSQYVRRYVREYWGREALVINPPIDLPEAEPDLAAKERIILSVGRFFTGGHAKRQDLMIDVFKQMCDAGLAGWELHLAGSVHRDGHNAGYFEAIEAAAQGYPISIHADAPYETVQDLYRRASIYWHAAGYHVDVNAQPIDFEHFGMTTAEAMGHGTVPIAIAAGGQIEVVQDGVDGYLWRELDDLKERTLRLIAYPGLRRELAAQARRSSHRFSREVFRKRMAEAIAPLVRELEAES